MKVVLLHDWLTGFRGGERVLEVFCEMFPDAPIYTLIHKKGSTSKIIESRKIYTSFLNNVSNIHQNYRKFLPLFPKATESLKIDDDVDLILSSSHCVIKGVIKPKGAKHICYIHSPMRYLYDQYDNYFGKNAPLYQRLGMKIFKKYLVDWDLISNSNVDLFLANSKFVQARVTKYYGRKSIVLNPFVDLIDFKCFWEKPAIKQDYYLMVTAFAPNKKVDLAIKAFNNNKKKLIIIGSGQQEESLKNLANSNINFVGNLSRKEVIDYMSKAKGFIFPGVEDFGITPLESLAALTPVIAYKIGGVLETLNDNVAQFFNEANVESLENAIKIFEKKSYKNENLIESAKKFSKEKFISRMNDELARN